MEAAVQDRRNGRPVKGLAKPRNLIAVIATDGGWVLGRHCRRVFANFLRPA